MTTLRAERAAVSVANLMTDPDARRRIENVMRVAGDTAVGAVSLIAGESEWSHSLDLRCDPTGRQVDGLDVAAVMDTHEGLEGTMLVGCRRDTFDDIAELLTGLPSSENLTVQGRAQEAANIIGSAYLNGVRHGMASDGLSDRSFLPSPPRFLRASVEVMVELAVGGQALGDRGWIADHRLWCESGEIVVVWVPTCEAILVMASDADEGVT